MEKEKLIQTLKEKSQVDNLSDRSIDEVATMFLSQFADDEKITDESWNIPVQMVKTMSGQLRHDLSGGINDFKVKFESENKAANEKAIADAVAKAKAEWEKANPKPADNKQEPEKTEPDVDKRIADALSKAMAGLTSEEGALGKLSKQFGDYLKLQQEKEKAATEADVRSQVRDYLIGRGVDEDDFALEYTLEKLAIGEKPDISALKVKAEKDYESNYKKIHKGDGGQPFAGGTGGGNDSNDAFKKFIEDRKAAADKEAKDAEELRQHMM